MNLCWCETCRVYHFSGEKCLDEFLCWIPEYGDEPEQPGATDRVRALDAESAAERSAEGLDDAGWDRRLAVAIVVAPVANPRNREAYRVTGELVFEFSPCKVDLPEGW